MVTRFRPLTRKVWRDLWHLRSQMLAVAVVMACGIAMFVTLRSMTGGSGIRRRNTTRRTGSRTSSRPHAGPHGAWSGSSPPSPGSLPCARGWSCDITARRLPDKLKPFASLYTSTVELEYVDHRIATFYSTLPNVNPDFIYVDGPSQYATLQDLRGISLASPERMPMSADILTIEFLLQPGTLIAIDGRTANARFLCAILKRNWSYYHDVDGDIHLLELQEAPLGPLNKRQLDFCLPDGWQLPATEKFT